MSNELIIGTCSLCGGPVSVPQVYMSIIPPTPRCKSCGAISAQQHGPTIPMVKPIASPGQRALRFCTNTSRQEDTIRFTTDGVERFSNGSTSENS